MPVPPDGEINQSRAMRKLAKMIQEKLNLDELPGVDDNAFALGATSLEMAALVRDFSDALGIDIPLGVFFEEACLGDAVRVVGELASTGRLHRVPLPGSGRAGQRRVVSLTQESRLVLDAAKQRPANNIVALLFRSGDDFDRDILECALRDVLKKHEVLRTTFDVEGLSGIANAVPAEVLEFQPQVAPGSESGLLEEFFNRPFDLARQIPFRALLVTLPGRESLLAVAVEHIVFDGLSVNILTADIAAFYEFRSGGADRPPPALPYQFADYAQAQRELLDPAYLKECLQYWSERLAPSGPYPRADLPCRPGRRGTELGRYRVAEATIEGADYQALTLALAEGEATPFQATLDALGRAADEVCGHPLPGVIAPYAGRDWRQADQLIGCFSDLIPICLSASGPDPARSMTRTVNAVRDAIAHADLPFGEVIRHLYPDEYRNVAEVPYIFLDVRDVSGAEDDGWSMGGCRWRAVDLLTAPQRLHPGISVAGQLRDHHFSLSIKYSAGVQQDGAMQRLAESATRHLMTLCASQQAR